jgi:hypothetical protein
LWFVFEDPNRPRPISADHQRQDQARPAEVYKQWRNDWRKGKRVYLDTCSEH